MNASLRTFPSAPWVFHESHAETSQSTTVKASPRAIWKQEVQMHGHEMVMKEPVLQGCCFLQWRSKSWKATPLPAPLCTWYQGLTRCQYGLFESQLQKAARQEKKKKKDSEAQQWFCRQKEEISAAVYEQGVRCIENRVNGHAQRVVVTGMSPVGG